MAMAQATAAFDAEPLILSYHLKKIPLPPPIEPGPPDPPSGEEPPAASPFTFDEQACYQSLRRRVAAWQREQGIRDLYAPAAYLYLWVVHVLSLLGANLGALYAATHGRWPLVYACAALASTLRALMLLREAHAATHYTVVASPRLNNLISQWSWGMISVQCADRLNASHVEIHHLYTSTPQLDDAAFPGVRTSAAEKHRPWNYLQPIYFLPVYALVLFFTPLEEWWELATRRRYAGRRALNLLFSVAFALFYYAGALVTGDVFWLLAAVCPASLILACTFAVNHQVIPCAQAADDHALHQAILQHRKTVDFGRYQVALTPNHSEESWWINQLFGGLNHHRTHHLFPKVHYHYYPALTKIINAALREQGVPTVTYPSFRAALAAHWELIRLRSRPEPAK